MHSSRNARSIHALGFLDLGLKGSAQLWEMVLTFDPPRLGSMRTNALAAQRCFGTPCTSAEPCR